MFGIAIIVGTMVAIFFQMNKSNDIVARFVDAVENEDIDTMKKLFQLEKGELFDEVPLNHFLLYLTQNEQKFQEVVISLKKQQDEKKEDPSAIVRLIIEGKKYGVFPSAHLAIRESKLEIEQDFSEEINVKANTTMLNRLHKNKPDTNRFIYGPVYPGEHLIDIQLYHELGEFLFKEQVEIWDEALTKIKLDEEEIITQDDSLKNYLFEKSALFSKQIGMLQIYEMNSYLLPNKTEGLHKSLQEMSEDLKGQSQLIFNEAIVDNASYNLMHIQHNWYADVRLIGKYEKDKSSNEDSEFILFNFEWVFDPEYGEWFIEDIIMSTTEKSVIELWNSDIKFGPNDLKLEQKVNGVL